MSREISQAQDRLVTVPLTKAYLEHAKAEGKSPTDPEIRKQIEVLQALIIRWLETDNHQYIDKAILTCRDEGLPILLPLLEHVAASVMMRRNGEFLTLENDNNLGNAFKIMANLIARNYTQKRASEIAAVWTADNGCRPLKASTLLKKYPGSGWPEIADEIGIHMRFWGENSEVEERWASLVRDCREITDEERGNRRD